MEPNKAAVAPPVGVSKGDRIVSFACVETLLTTVISVSVGESGNGGVELLSANVYGSHGIGGNAVSIEKLMVEQLTVGISFSLLMVVVACCNSALSSTRQVSLDEAPMMTGNVMNWFTSSLDVVAADTQIWYSTWSNALESWTVGGVSDGIAKFDVTVCLKLFALLIIMSCVVVCWILSLA